MSQNNANGQNHSRFMPHRNFRLFEYQREDGIEQRFNYNIPLVGVNEEDGFTQLLADYGTVAAPLIRVEQPVTTLILRPPIPKEEIASFGKAIVEFANANDYGADEIYGREIRFWDQTEKDRAILVASSTEERLGELVTREVVGADTLGANV